MPIGTEPTMGLLEKALYTDAKLNEICGGKPNVYRDKVPPIIKYPFIFLAEATESEDLRDSESVGPPHVWTERVWDDTNKVLNLVDHKQEPSHVEFLRVHVVCYGSGGDLPWAIMSRVRSLVIDEVGKPDMFTDGPFDIRGLTETRQNLLPTPFDDENGRDIYQSTQTLLLYTKKKGGV